MKKIEEMYQEILQDEGLKAEFAQAAKDNQIEAFLQKNDCNGTLSELQELAEKKQSEIGSLSDAELDAAAGGYDLAEALESLTTVGLGCAILAGVSALGKGVGPRGDSDPLLCPDVDF